MILGITVIVDQATGYRARLFDKRWGPTQSRLRELPFPWARAIRIRVTIGKLEDEGMSVIGFEEPGRFVVDIGLSSAKTYELSIQEVNDVVIGCLFDALAAAYTHFEQAIPEELPELRRLALQR